VLAVYRKRPPKNQKAVLMIGRLFILLILNGLNEAVALAISQRVSREPVGRSSVSNLAFLQSRRHGVNPSFNRVPDQRIKFPDTSLLMPSSDSSLI